MFTHSFFLRFIDIFYEKYGLRIDRYIFVLTPFCVNLKTSISMPKKLLFILMLVGASNVFAQNLYDDSNAASPNNETNSTTGWSGSALLFSDNTDAQSGLYSIRAESNGNNGTYVEYSFDAVVGENYTISIWAREGDQSNQPAFANWQGLSGFSTTNILGTTWTEYVFNVTATSTSPGIRVYTSPWAARLQAGNAVLIDNISILPEGGGETDNEAPSAVVDLSSSGTTSTGTVLSWSASTDNVGVVNYEVFQDGVSIANTGTATTFNVTGLSAGTSYDFTVLAEDAAGNVSAAGNTETVVTQSGTGVIDYTSENANIATVDWIARDLFADRNIGIGTTDTQGYRLAVAGNVIAEGVKVELQGNWPDFVFEKDYDLPRLDEVKAFIAAFGHLPNIPSAQKVKEEGIDLGDMNAKLLQKIEELTLYIISQNYEIQKLKEENNKINDILNRLEKLENKK